MRGGCLRSADPFLGWEAGSHRRGMGGGEEKAGIRTLGAGDPFRELLLPGWDLEASSSGRFSGLTCFGSLQGVALVIPV